jgi:hypothetical protein
LTILVELLSCSVLGDASPKEKKMARNDFDYDDAPATPDYTAADFPEDATSTAPAWTPRASRDPGSAYNNTPAEWEKHEEAPESLRSSAFDPYDDGMPF